MTNDIEMSDRAIFADTSDTIRKALEKSNAINDRKIGIARTAFEIALKQLV